MYAYHYGLITELASAGAPAAGAVPAGDYSFWTEHWRRLGRDAGRSKTSRATDKVVAREPVEATGARAEASTGDAQGTERRTVASSPRSDELTAASERADEDDIEMLLLVTI